MVSTYPEESRSTTSSRSGGGTLQSCHHVAMMLLGEGGAALCLSALGGAQQIPGAPLELQAVHFLPDSQSGSRSIWLDALEVNQHQIVSNDTHQL